MRLTILLTFGMLLAALSYGQDAKKQSEGANIFGEQCVNCHGPDGRAQTDMGKQLSAADLTGQQVQGMSDSQIAKIVKGGKEKMPAFGDKLSDDDIKAVVAYVRQLGKSR